MQFELTDALIDEILFFMEDQGGEFYIDTVEGIVAGGMEGLDFYFDANPEIDRDDESRFIDLPEWHSSDGFSLMEQFAAGFKNPLIRTELTRALGQGRGVFRAFKDTLGRYPEAEKLWFSFKEKEMKQVIITWYNGLREEWGLEKIGAEPEETGDLVLEDFRFRPFIKEDLDKAEELYNHCLEEHRGMLAENGQKNSSTAIIRESMIFFSSMENIFSSKHREGELLPPLYAMAAETSGGEFVGYIAGVLENAVLYIQNLEIKNEYRGLGVGEALLLKFLESFELEEISQIFMDLPSWAEGFSRVLLRESFQPYSVRYRLDPRQKQ